MRARAPARRPRRRRHPCRGRRPRPARRAPALKSRAVSDPLRTSEPVTDPFLICLPVTSELAAARIGAAMDEPARASTSARPATTMAGEGSLSRGIRLTRRIAHRYSGSARLAAGEGVGDRLLERDVARLAELQAGGERSAG